MSNRDSEIRGRIRDLAEVFGTKAPSDTALGIWCQILSDVNTDAVLLAIGDWPRHHRTMPTPADIRTEAIKRVSSRLEADARRQAEQSHNEPDTADWVRSVAPENVRLALDTFRQAHSDAHAGDRRWIDLQIGWWARGWHEIEDFRVDRDASGRIVQIVTVKKRCPVTTAQEAVVRRAFGGELPPKDHPRVKWCLRSVEEQESKERMAQPFADLLRDIAAMRGGSRTQARQMPEPPDWI